MLQEQVTVQNRIESDFPLVSPLTYVWYDEEVDTAEILRVLERAADDARFIAQLTHNGSRALQGYDLTEEAKAALLSGDIRWVEGHVGKLDARLRTWLDCRLQQEIW